VRLQVDKCHAERQALAAKQRSKGWSEERIADAVHTLKEKQHAQEEKGGPSGWAGEGFYVLGGLDHNVVRFFKVLAMVSG
jgi:hypothetical protein